MGLVCEIPGFLAFSLSLSFCSSLCVWKTSSINELLKVINDSISFDFPFSFFVQIKKNVSQIQMRHDCKTNHTKKEVTSSCSCISSSPQRLYNRVFSRFFYLTPI